MGWETKGGGRGANRREGRQRRDGAAGGTRSVPCGFLWFFVGRLWVACGSLVGRLWVACGSPVGRLWVACGSLVGRLWVACGSPVHVEKTTNYQLSPGNNWIYLYPLVLSLSRLYLYQGSTTEAGLECSNVPVFPSYRPHPILTLFENPARSSPRSKSFLQCPPSPHSAPSPSPSRGTQSG